MTIVCCTVFCSTIYCKKTSQRPRWQPHLEESCDAPGQAPASHCLPSPPGLAGKGSLDAKGSGHSLAYPLWVWSLGPMPGSVLCSQVTHRHLPEEMLGGQGWPQSLGPPQILQHSQTGVTAASVVEKNKAFLGQNAFVGEGQECSGRKRGQKVSTGRRLVPHIETQHRSYTKASTKTGFL